MFPIKIVFTKNTNTNTKLYTLQLHFVQFVGQMLIVGPREFGGGAVIVQLTSEELHLLSKLLYLLLCCFKSFAAKLDPKIEIYSCAYLS